LDRQSDVKNFALSIKAVSQKKINKAASHFAILDLIHRVNERVSADRKIKSADKNATLGFAHQITSH